MSADARFMNPDWVLVGAPITLEGRQAFMVIASRDLLSARVTDTTEAEDCYSLHGFQQRIVNRSVRLETDLREFTVAYGDSYQAALAKIFESWNPDGSAPGPQLSEGTKAVGQ